MAFVGWVLPLLGSSVWIQTIPDDGGRHEGQGPPNPKQP